MADLSPTAASVRNASPVGQSIVTDFIAAVAIDAGEGVYINSSGKAALADASAAGTAVCVGVALESVSAGEAVPVLQVGYVEGMGVSAVAYNTIVKVSDTAGAFDNGAGSPTVSCPVGRVMPATDGSLTKLLFVNCLYNMNVVPA